VIVCHCAVVSSGDIARAHDEGARSVSEVCRRTGAARQCGTCVFSVRQVLCQHVEQPGTTIKEAARAAS